MAQQNNVPNFDSMNRDELLDFWTTYRNASRKQIRALFKLTKKDAPKGYTRVANDLANYAINKGVAMSAREDGKISTAEIYERICESIHNSLPDYARW